MHLAGHQRGDRPLRLHQPAHWLVEYALSDSDGGQLHDLGRLLAVALDVDYHQALPGQGGVGGHLLDPGLVGPVERHLAAVELAGRADVAQLPDANVAVVVGQPVRVGNPARGGLPDQRRPSRVRAQPVRSQLAERGEDATLQLGRQHLAAGGGLVGLGQAELAVVPLDLGVV